MSQEPQLGRFTSMDGSGLTIEELIAMLRETIGPKARRHNVIRLWQGDESTGRMAEVIGIKIGQSDQAEPYELIVSLILEGQ